MWLPNCCHQNDETTGLEILRPVCENSMVEFGSD